MSVPAGHTWIRSTDNDVPPINYASKRFVELKDTSGHTPRHVLVGAAVPQLDTEQRQRTIIHYSGPAEVRWGLLLHELYAATENMDRQRGLSIHP